MSVRFTDEQNVGLYDSVSMTAIEGPLFGSVAHAEDFMAWMDEECHGDPREADMSTMALMDFHATWTYSVLSGERSV